MDQLPRLGKRELICLLLFTCNYVVSVWRGFLFLWVLGMGYVILLWHSLSLHIIILRICNRFYNLIIGLSVVERLKTYDVEKVVSTFLGCFPSNPFRCREAGKHGRDVQIFTISTGIKSVRCRGKITVFHHFP